MKVKQHNSTLSANTDKPLRSRTPLKSKRPYRKKNRIKGIRDDDFLHKVFVDDVRKRDQVCIGVGHCTDCPYDPTDEQCLVVHHVKRKASHPEFRFHPENGVLIHSICHGRCHADLRWEYELLRKACVVDRINRMMGHGHNLREEISAVDAIMN